MQQNTNHFSFARLKKYIGDYRFNSLLIRNFCLTLLVIILPIILCVLFYYSNVKNILEDEIASMNQNTLQQTVNIMDSTLEDAKQMTIELSTRSDVQLLRYQTLEQLRQSSDTSKVTDDLSLISSLYHYIDSVYIYFEANDLIFYDDQVLPLKYVSDRDWITSYQKVDTRKIHFQYREKRGTYPYLLTLIYPIYSDMGRRSGAIITNINIENWGNFKNDTSSDIEFYCFDDSLQLYCSNDRTLFSAGNTLPDSLSFLSDVNEDFSKQLTIDGDDVILSCICSSHTPLKYVAVTPVSAYQQKIDHFNTTMLVILALGIIFCFFASMLITLRTYQPVLSILHLLEQETAPQTIQSSQRPDELFFIQNQLYSSKQKSQQLQTTLTQQMKQLNRAQIDALQTQIDPHFLYNTLDTINWMSVRQNGGKNAVSDMIASLGKLLQISLKKDSYLVSVKEEIEHTKIYLELLDKRYQDRLHVQWDIDESILDCQIAKLSLQPIVENSVMHGLRQKRYYGTILIEGRHENGCGIISITDDGVGMSPEEMELLQKSLNEASGDSHIGLRNVHKRFCLLFGDSYGISLAPPASRESGLTVTVHFPYYDL